MTFLAINITLFVDGDRGGILIAKNVINNANVTYVAVAPDGKEVEELMGKEILMGLRKRIPASDFMRKMDRMGSGNGDNGKHVEEESVNEVEIKKKLKEAYNEIRDSKRAVFLNRSLSVVKSVSASSAISTLERSENIYAIVIDGSATPNLIRLCDDMNVMYLAARTFSSMEDDFKVKLVSL